MSDIDRFSPDGIHAYTFKDSAVRNGLAADMDFTGFTPPSGGGGGSFPLDIQNPTDGQSLIYDATNQCWKNGPVLHEYSTDEKVVGTWIDGKPLYEKTIQGNIPTVSTDMTPVDYFADLGVSIDYGFVVFGNFVTSGGVIFDMDTYAYGNTTGLKNLIVTIFSNSSNNPNKVRIRSNNTGWNNFDFTLVVRYTKTTDSPSNS